MGRMAALLGPGPSGGSALTPLAHGSGLDDILIAASVAVLAVAGNYLWQHRRARPPATGEREGPRERQEGEP
jgi:hypothetical protein